MVNHQEMKPSSVPLFRETAEEWLAAKSAVLKASSISRYRGTLDRYLLPEFGARSVTEITRGQANAFVQRLMSERGLSSGTAAAVLSVLKNIQHFGAQVKELPVTDLQGISVRQPYKPLRVFSRSEQQQLSRYLLSRRDLPSLGILLALYTGLRIGELCALKWEDIALEEGCLTVRHTMQRLPSPEGERRTAVVITAPKSLCSQRTIPIPENLRALLRRVKAPPDCFFLTGRVDYIEPRSLENRFKAALRAAGLPEVKFHTCRHSFATRCIELGFDVKSLSEILGHASVNITMNRYVHPSMDFKRENMNLLGSLIDEQD